MAQTVTRDVTQRSWQGQHVKLAQVIDQLNRHHIELRGREQEHELAESMHPHPRNSVANLVITVSDEGWADLADRVTESVSVSHPLRAILVHTVESDEDVLDAEVLSEVHHLSTGAAIQRERIILRLGGPATRHIASIVEPLLLPDVRSYLWWTGTPDLDQRTLREALAACDMLIVDSLLFQRPAHSLLQLAALSEREGARKGFTDLQWKRLRPWRDSIARFFAPMERRSFLAGITMVDVAAVGERTVHQSAATLLTGWIASALGWRIQQASVISDAWGDALMQMPSGKLVEVSLRAEAEPRLNPGEPLSLSIEGTSENVDFSFKLEVDRAAGDVGQVEIHIGDQYSAQQRLSLPRRSETDLLMYALADGHREPVFSRSLAAAADVVGALR